MTNDNVTRLAEKIFMGVARAEMGRDHIESLLREAMEARSTEWQELCDKSWDKGFEKGLTHAAEVADKDEHCECDGFKTSFELERCGQCGNVFPCCHKPERCEAGLT